MQFKLNVLWEPSDEELQRVTLSAKRVKERTLSKIKTANPVTGQHRKRFFTPLIAIVAVIAVTGCALAATYQLWSPFWAQKWGVTESVQDKLLQSRATVLVDGASTTTETGLIYTVKQVLGDGHTVYVLIECSANGSNILSQQWIDDMKLLSGISIKYGNSSVEALTSFQWSLDDQDTSKAYLGLTFTCEAVQSRDLTISIRDRSTYNDDSLVSQWKAEAAKGSETAQQWLTAYGRWKENPLLVPWTLNFTLDYNKDTFQTYELSQDFNVQYNVFSPLTQTNKHYDIWATVSNCSVSPISMFVTLDITGTTSRESQLEGQMTDGYLTLTDGSQVTFWLKKIDNGSSSASQQTTYYYVFQKAVDPSELASVTLERDGCVLPEDVQPGDHVVRAQVDIDGTRYEEVIHDTVTFPFHNSN
jgi:hypothetical protein